MPKTFVSDSQKEIKHINEMIQDAEHADQWNNDYGQEGDNINLLGPRPNDIGLPMDFPMKKRNTCMRIICLIFCCQTG